MTHSLIGRIRLARLVLTTNKIGPSASPIILYPVTLRSHSNAKQTKSPKAKSEIRHQFILTETKTKQIPLPYVQAIGWLFGSNHAVTP